MRASRQLKNRSGHRKQKTVNDLLFILEKLTASMEVMGDIQKLSVDSQYRLEKRLKDWETSYE